MTSWLHNIFNAISGGLLIRIFCHSALGENLGCFGGSKKKKDGQPVQKETTASRTTSPRTEPVRGMELLWQPEVVQSYLSLLQTCSNPETLEAAAGALQNLAACYWQPSIEIRAAVRKEKGLPILVELLRMEVITRCQIFEYTKGIHDYKVYTLN